MDETISLELDELQRRYRIMEGDRRSYAEEVQNVVRKQKAQIEKLTKENASLKSELSLQSRAATLGDTGIVSTRMTQLQDAIDAVTRQIEAEKARCEEIDGRIRAVREGVMAERREMGGNNAPQEQNQAIHKQTKVLEHRLHRSLVKFNEAIAANKELREEIDNLRRERVVFDGIYKKLQHELAEKKKKMAEIIEAANVAYEARDRAQASMASLKAAAEREQADFESEWKELGLKLEEDRRRQDFLARERARVLSTEQRGEMSLEEEAALKRAVNKGAWELATQGAARTAGMERVQSYEEAFARIQEATGLADTDELVAKFIESEDKNFKMFKYLNELNAEIEKGEAEISEIKAEMEKFRGQDKGAASQRKRLIKEMQDRAADCDAKAAQHEDQAKGLMATISSVGASLEALTSRIGGSTRMLADMGAEGGCNESNVLVYLGVVEQRANEMLAACMLQQSGSKLAASAASAAALVGPATPAGHAVSIAVPTTADEHDSDESDEEAQPLSRDELHARTLRGLARRESANKKHPATKAGFGSKRATGRL